MHKIMKQLHQDHIHLSRLLKMLVRHVRVLQDGGDPDFVMMIDIVEYIRTYSDNHHHPKEDEVYQVVKSKNKKVAHLVEGLLNEHQQIPKVTIAFEELLKGALSGYLIIQRDELTEKITNFIDIQWSHLNTEEDKLFPLINKLMTSADWKQVEAQIEEKDDPLFGANVEKQFENLLSLSSRTLEAD